MKNDIFMRKCLLIPRMEKILSGAENGQRRQLCTGPGNGGI